jgi:hypothetical protein
MGSATSSELEDYASGNQVNVRFASGILVAHFEVAFPFHAKSNRLAQVVLTAQTQ